MLRVEVDIFSGRPNPAWIITDEDAVRTLLSEVADAAEDVVGLPGEGFDGLGYREVVLSAVSDDQVWPGSVPREFALGTTGARDVARSTELARRVVSGMTRHAGTSLREHGLTPVDEHMRDLVLREIDRFADAPPPFFRAPRLPSHPSVGTAPSEDAESAAVCLVELGNYNPAFWNRPEVQPNNNCYNYAGDRRTDTFAQPGRAHGSEFRAHTCPDVTNAMFVDGLVRSTQCLPDSENPRWLLAMVIWPGTDFHFFRKHQELFWGHKPGRDTARNYDNSGVRISDPQTANRGPYSDFCGFFHMGRSVVIR
ncbi:hypothetical protein [Streptomyces albireticuli]|uniref:Uncharacterized protein n=1 Tax=Streptomyces albireticuli TaxID=1940 RepID=A0A2A2CZV7_9ACTN|nr:hypothetical protein [Streptomyces albireticuli]MCD9145018.1 hypothetical protein [Streptomyces albireticuli]MCD9164444.1 hypothetical protein [Streptomyces albireticuli]MCD9194155.1 hypothetical protein [Streptomyces albireticuli]PAU44795.1 hypothetical protein CK936_32990 [Streptomyces albireticuli]